MRRGRGAAHSLRLLPTLRKEDNMNNSVKTAVIVTALILSAFVLVSTDVDAEAQELIPISTQDELTQAFTNGGSYQLTGNISFGEVTASDSERNPILTVPTGVQVTLDLNGHSITASIVSGSGSYANCQVILNYGTLKITDSVGGGLISNNYENSNACTRTIKNDADAMLTISGGTIRSAGAVGLLNLGTCYITGGTIESLKAGYSGGWDNACAAVENRDNGHMEITGGTLSSVSESGLFVDGYNTTSISGGTIIGSDAYGAINGSSTDNYVAITGGTFSSDVSTMTERGYYVEDFGNGSYGVLPVPSTSNTVYDESAFYGALPSSNNTASVLTIGADLTLSETFTVLENTEIVVPEGFTLTIGADSVVSLRGILTNNGEVSIDGYISNPFNITGDGAVTGVSEILSDGVYEIETAMDLQWLAYLMNEHPDTVWDVRLMNDITIPEGVDFQMLGTASSGNGYLPFYGSFDGNGHSITGLTISSISTGIGLFYGLTDAEVRDLELVDVDYETTTGYIGGLAANCSGDVRISNVTVSGSLDVLGASYGCAAIIAALSNGNIEFISCSSSASIGGPNAYNVGSMFGTASGVVGDVGIYNCSNSGTITAAGSVGYVFGFGHLNAASTLEIIGFDNTYDGGLTYSSATGSGYTLSTNYMDPQYEAVMGANGDWTILEDGQSIVAEIDGVQFATLADAFAVAEDGSTIVLLTGVTEAVTLSSGNSITLDLNGHTLHYNETIPYSQGGDETIKIVNGTLTITDSSDWSVTVDDYNVIYTGDGAVTYDGSGRAIMVSGENAHLVVNGGYIHSIGGDGIYVTGNTTPGDSAWNCTVTMNGGYVQSTEYGIGVAGNGAVLTMKGGYVEADNNAAIAGNGTNNETFYKGGTTITITGGTVIGNITSPGYISCGIYHPQSGTLTISGGTIVSTDGVGVLMRGGQMEMTGGTIVSKTNGTEGGVGDSSIDVPPYGVVLDGSAKYYGFEDASVIVSGGSIEAETPFGVLEHPSISSSDKIQVSGGTYTGEVGTEFIAEGFVLTGSEGSYTVIEQFTVSFVIGDQTSTLDVVSGGSVTVPVVTDPQGFDHVWSDGTMTYTDSEVGAMTIVSDITFTISYILEVPEVTITSSNSNPVVGDNVVLTASVSNTAEGATYSYEWSDGSTGESITVSSSGTYTVEVTVSYEDQTEAGTASVTLTFGPNMTTDEDGSTITVTENPDGSVTTTVERTDGSITETTESIIEGMETETVVETPADSSVSQTITTTISVTDNSQVTETMVQQAINKINESTDSTDAEKILAFESGIGESVSVPTSSLDEISSAGISLSLTSSDVSVTFSPITLDSISQQAEGVPEATSIVTIAEDVSGTLNPSQSSTVGDATVYDVSAFLVDENDEVVMQVSRLGDMTPVTIPYELPEGVSPEDVVVYYMDDYGNLTARETVYSEGKVTFWTEHFSYYVIGDRSMIADEPTDPDFPPFNPGWNDDEPPYIPPTIVVEDNGDGSDDESVKIAACCAAAVAAAILAAFIIMEYRRR